MATAFNAWAPEIDPDIPGLPEPALVAAVRSAVIEFCEKTLLWIEDLTRISIVANDKDYTLTVDPTLYGQIVQVDSVKYKADGADDDEFRTLDPIAKANENIASHGSWPYHEATEPTHFFVDEHDNTNLILYPIPTEASASGLLVSVSLMPTIAATEGPDFIYNQHRETIALGAKSKLFARKGMPWYDPNEAERCRLRFGGRINSAKWKKITGATNRPLQVRMRRFV